MASSQPADVQPNPMLRPVRHRGQPPEVLSACDPWPCAHARGEWSRMRRQNLREELRMKITYIDLRPAGKEDSVEVQLNLDGDWIPGTPGHTAKTSTAAGERGSSTPRAQAASHVDWFAE